MCRSSYPVGFIVVAILWPWNSR